MSSASSGNLQVLLLGAAVDHSTIDLLMKVDRIPQVQTFRFQWALIGAIEQALGRAVDVLATVPTRDWPFTRKIWFGGKRGTRSQKSEVRDQNAVLTADTSSLWVQMPMINLLGLKQVSRFVTSSWYLSRWLIAHRGQEKIILSYGVIVPHLIPAAILAGISGARLVSVVTDAPLTYHDEGLVYRVARWFDRMLLRSCMASLDGVIALTRPLAQRLAPGVPSLVMEGIISDDAERYGRDQSSQKSEIRDQDSELTSDLCPLTSSVSTFTVIYAGQLHADYGVKALLDAFALCDDPRFRLVLYGQGTLEAEIRSAAAADPRIRYEGFQPAEVIFPAMLQADVMVVPRFPNDRMAEYSFPSKLLEYLAMGRLVISAKLPSIPAEYFDHLVLVNKIDPPTLAAKFREVADWSVEQRRRREEAAFRFAFSSKTQLHQGHRIVQFLESICTKE